MRLVLLYAACAASLATSAWGQNLPDCSVGMRVPKAGIFNYPATIIAVDPAKGGYQVRYTDGGSTEWLTASGLKWSCKAGVATVSDGFFNGNWEMFVGPAPQTREINGDLWLVVGPGAVAPPLAIKADGTYTWVIDRNTIINGRWRKMSTAEMKYGTTGKAPAIMLMNAYGGANWQVTRLGVRLSDKRDQLTVERMDLGLNYLATRMR